MFAESPSGSQPSAVLAPVTADVVAGVPSYDAAPRISDIGQTELSQPTRPLAIPAQTRSTFTLSRVERIRVRVFGYADLSGEYAIDPDLSLSFPRIGRIEVGGVSLAELEQLLANKLSSLARNDVDVAVEVAKFRPYFIMGHVTEAGAMEWSPGLKIIQAISLAHGVTRSASDSTYGSDSPRLLGSRQSQRQLALTRAQVERLKSERDGADVATATGRIDTLIRNASESDRATLTSLVSRQNDMLAEQRKITETEISGLQSARDAAERELKAAETQEHAVLNHLESTRAQMTSLEGLKDKQLISNSRIFEQRSILFAAESRYAEARLAVERARTQLLNVKQQLIMLPQQRSATLSERIDVLEREIAQLELAARGDEQDNQDVTKLKYHIAREGGAGLQTIEATIFTEIMPGDVVIVSAEKDDSVPAIGATSPSNGSKEASAADVTQQVIEASAIVPLPPVSRRAFSSTGPSTRSNF